MKFNDLQKISYISIIVQIIFDKIGESTIPDKVLTYYEPFIKIAAEKFKAIQDPFLQLQSLGKKFETVIQKYPNNAAFCSRNCLKSLGIVQSKWNFNTNLRLARLALYSLSKFGQLPVRCICISIASVATLQIWIIF